MKPGHWRVPFDKKLKDKTNESKGFYQKTQCRLQNRAPQG